MIQCLLSYLLLFLTYKRSIFLEMDGIQAPPKGTLGTVRGVDDAGSIMASWDTGSSLSVVYGEDIVEKVTE